MSEDKIEQLIRNHPHIFERSDKFEISIGDGWFSIIDTLMSLICHPLESAERRFKYALENPQFSDAKAIANLEAYVAEERAKIPTITQIKEKFGSLRFYYDNGADIDQYVTFAEQMSGTMCEECGSPGTFRTGGWVRVLCDYHDSIRFDPNKAG